MIFISPLNVKRQKPNFNLWMVANTKCYASERKIDAFFVVFLIRLPKYQLIRPHMFPTGLIFVIRRWIHAFMDTQTRQSYDPSLKSGKSWEKISILLITPKLDFAAYQIFFQRQKIVQLTCWMRKNQIFLRRKNLRHAWNFTELFKLD